MITHHGRLTQFPAAIRPPFATMARWSELPPKYATAVNRLAWLGAPKAGLTVASICKQHGEVRRDQLIASACLTEAFVEIIILLGFLSMPALHREKQYQVLEFFGGAARTARLAKGLKLKSGSLDKSYHNSMDINTDAGFLLLACRSNPWTQ